MKKTLAFLGILTFAGVIWANPPVPAALEKSAVDASKSESASKATCTGAGVNTERKVEGETLQIPQVEGEDKKAVGSN